MEYIYDIVLNFHPCYYEYYEWQSTDKIISIKKIPIYKINNKTYLDLKYNDIIINKTSLPKNNKMFLVTSGIEVMGLLLDKENRISKRSSLIFEEADDILEDKDSLKEINLKYTITNHQKPTYLSRLSKEKSSYIINYLNNLDPIKDEYTLKYLYYDIYNIEEKDSNIIYAKLLSLTKEDINKIYESVKRVNIELK